MNNLITISDFVGDMQLSIQSDFAQDFDALITKIQAEFLRKVLGVTMYNQLVAAFDTEDTVAQKWTDLVNGADFTLDGELEHFEGLKKALTLYAYVKLQQMITVTHTPSGNVTMKTENAMPASPLFKVVHAQNDCMLLADFLQYYIYANATDFPDYVYGLPFTHLYNSFGI